MDRSCPQVDTGSVTAVVERRMRIAAYVICRDDRERFLLTRLVTADGAPRWTLPGGGLDPGEHPEDGALRELTEETGFTGALDALLDVDTLHIQDGTLDVYAIRVVYRARVTGGQLTHEVDGSTDLAQWFIRAEIATLDSLSLVRIALGADDRPGRPLPTRRPSSGPEAVVGPPALVVHAVLRRPDDRVLLVPRRFADRTEWDLPGGRAEHGEALPTALSRLVADTAGVEVRGETVLAAGLDPDAAAVRITCTASTDVEPAPARPGQRWCTPDELARIPLLPAAGEALDVLPAGTGPRTAHK
jgi:ADP-ribose pyrophosphatase YjhB (NUDIX family)